MKVLVYGSKGWIGSQVCKLLDELSIEWIEGKVRAENLEGIEEEIIQVSPTHVMSFIGRTHGKINETEYTTIDYLEQKGKIKENVRDNLYSPIVLAILSNKYNFHYTYLGTGCIFEYDEFHKFEEELNGFDESAVPNFFGSGYSVVKGYTDRLMHMFPNVLNVRIRMPITSDLNPRNFITKICTYKKVCSVKNSMTVLPELLPLLIDMGKSKIVGTVNLTNPGLISHNEILEIYREIVDPDFVWENFTIEEQNEILAAGRSNNYLDTTRLEQLYPKVKNIKDSVRECLEQVKFSSESNIILSQLLDNKYMYKNYFELNEEQITYQLIEKNNNIIIEEIKEEFKNIDSINIIGKGESARYINNAIGINQGIIFTNKKYLFMNDFVSFFGIEEFIKDIKYIFVPDYPHDGGGVDINLTYKNVVRYLKKYDFNGKLFIYQIQTTLSDFKFKDFLFESKSSTDIPITLFNKFIGINNFELYGVCKGPLYHKDLLNLNFKYISLDSEYVDLYNKYLILYTKFFNKSISLYDDTRQNLFSNNYESIKNTLRIKINFN